ncbi:MAG TPA: hypothetical protein VIS74_01995, partial [Chthoniobacterales bacterium]
MRAFAGGSRVLRWIIAAAALAMPLHAAEVTVVGYNVQNYLLMDRQVDGQKVKDAPKPENEVTALIHVITQLKPDILGLCELGGSAQLADLQNRLKQAGLDLPHAEWIQGADTDRHVVLLSRFPIVARNSVSDIPLTLNGQAAGMQ